MSDETPNCRTCGACCLASAWSDLDIGPVLDLVRHHPFVFMNAYEADAVTSHGLRSGKRLVTVHASAFQTGDEGFSMKIKNDRRGRCAALTGTVGRRVECSVYTDRPSVCVDFEPGSPECHEVREKVLGIKSPLAVESR